jgi:hemoglobin
VRPSIFEAAGGEDAFQRLSTAHHALCLADPLLNHPFSHPGHPQHVERLGVYWAEVFGGPAVFSTECGNHTGMLTLHAGCQAEAEMGSRFIDCFVKAADDAELPDDPELRAVLRAYMEWAVAEVMFYSPQGSEVPGGLGVPHWSWDGLETSA